MKIFLRFLLILILISISYILYKNSVITEGFISGTQIQLLTSKPYYTWYDFLRNPWRNPLQYPSQYPFPFQYPIRYTYPLSYRYPYYTYPRYYYGYPFYKPKKI